MIHIFVVSDSSMFNSNQHLGVTNLENIFAMFEYSVGMQGSEKWEYFYRQTRQISKTADFQNVKMFI